MSSGSRQAIEEIFSYISAGRIEDAEARCRRTLEQVPDDINVMGALGAILLKTGRTDEAETTLKRTIELEPRFAKPHEDLGMLYLDRGDAAAALQYLEKAVSLNGNEASAHKAMVVALRQLGRHDEAVAAQQRYLALAPGQDPLGEAEMLRRNGKREDAERICQQILDREPEHLGALRMLAVIANDDERFVIAEGLFRRVVTLSPENAAALGDLGQFLSEQSRFPEAIDVLQQASAIADTNPRIWLALGDLLAIVGRTADALAAYDKSLEFAPDEAAALTGRGHMLRIAGRKDDAIAAYQKAIDATPDAGDGWWNLASLHGYTFNDGNVEEMRALLAKGGMAPESEVPLRFAHARAMEQRGDFAGAWAQFSRANAMKRSQIKYDPVEAEVTNRKIIDTFSEKLLKQSSADTPTDQTPVFIVGMPRSGSTLIEQIIASHSNVSGLGELPYLVMMTHALVGEDDDRMRYPSVMPELDDAKLTGLGRSYLYHATAHRHAAGKRDAQRDESC